MIRLRGILCRKNRRRVEGVGWCNGAALLASAAIAVRLVGSAGVAATAEGGKIHAEALSSLRKQKPWRESLRVMACRRYRYHAVPSLTVGVRSEMPRADRNLGLNPDCKGGDMLTDLAATVREKSLARRAGYGFPRGGDSMKLAKSSTWIFIFLRQFGYCQVLPGRFCCSVSPVRSS